MRGNVMDLAIAVIIGAAFGKIITSIVDDIIMPPIGLLLGNVDFSNLFVSLNGQSYASLAAAEAAGAPTINYGLFLNTLIQFLIIALVLFLIIRALNRFKRAPQEDVESPKTKECPYCVSTIPVGAVRCPECTSDLKAAPVTA
jgi:large conductance mechanosensitive channel